MSSREASLGVAGQQQGRRSASSRSGWAVCAWLGGGSKDNATANSQHQQHGISRRRSFLDLHSQFRKLVFGFLSFVFYALSPGRLCLGFAGSVVLGGDAAGRPSGRTSRVSMQ